MCDLAQSLIGNHLRPDPGQCARAVANRIEGSVKVLGDDQVEEGVPDKRKALVTVAAALRP